MQITETLEHAIFNCLHNSQTADYLLLVAKQFCPGLSAADSLWLSFNLRKDHELALVYLLSIGFKFIWGKRVKKKEVNVSVLKAEIGSRIEIFLSSKYNWLLNY